jgi:hypothetical protein
MMDLPHKAAHADTESDKIKEGLKEGRNETDLPALLVNPQVPLPDPKKPL